MSSNTAPWLNRNVNLIYVVLQPQAPSVQGEATLPLGRVKRGLQIFLLETFPDDSFHLSHFLIISVEEWGKMKIKI